MTALETIRACLNGAKDKILDREEIQPGYLPFEDGYHEGYVDGITASFEAFGKILDAVENSL